MSVDGPHRRPGQPHVVGHGPPFVAAARPFVEPVRRGFDLLMGTEGEVTLEIGLATTFSLPESGYFVVMRRDSAEVDLSMVSVSQDYRLVGPDGQRDRRLSVRSPGSRGFDQARRLVPGAGIGGRYAALREDVAKGRLENVKESLAIFKRTTLASPDLLSQDAVRLVEAVGEEIDRTLQ